MTQEDAIRVVKKHLASHQPAGYHLEVLSGSARQEDDWWYVAVRAVGKDVPRYDYYNVLAVVEREIEEEDESFNILLVPAAADRQEKQVNENG